MNMAGTSEGSHENLPNVDLPGGDINIRPAVSIADYRACQEAQRLAWGIREDGYLIPLATMVGAQHHGGLVLGAFRPDGQAVAMSFAFLGRLRGEICLYSQLTGVIPGYQSLGLGYQIKQVQRQFAAREKIATIAWAFDPLQAGNARFNLDKLGATASRYIENMYGERTDQLNFGVPTDRLIAEWQVNPGESAARIDLAIGEIPSLISTEPRADGQMAPVALSPDWSSQSLRLKIPPEIGRLRSEQPRLAEAWRIAVRDAFVSAFGEGYRAIGFSRTKIPDGSEICEYLLQRGAS
jgi:predicted GNAT superfamily acetyltransferase